MRKAFLALLVAVLIAPVAAGAAKPELQTEQQYLDRLLAMEDTAAAHVELAQWCAANGLQERAKVHWQEALVRDGDHPKARAAMGFVRRGTQWVPAAQARARPVPQASDDKAFYARQHQIRERILEISRELLVATDPDKWNEGRKAILMLRDPAAADPVARILGAGNIEIRMLAAEVLAQIPRDEALRYLLGFALGDPSPAVCTQAVESLKLRDDPRVVRQLIYALVRGREPTMRRAATALAELGAWEAVPALISNLKTVEYRTVLEKELRRPLPVFNGLVVPYVASLRPVVARGVVAYDPIIGYVTPAGVLVPELAPPVEVTTMKTKAKLIEQPRVLEALKRITGRDFGYDEAAWRQWLARYERQQAAQANAGT